MKRFRKSSRKPLRKTQKRTLKRKMKTMKGGIGKDNGKLVLSPDEQAEADRINTMFKDRAAWFKKDEFEKYFEKNGKKSEFDAFVKEKDKERENSELLLAKFATGSLH